MPRLCRPGVPGEKRRGHRIRTLPSAFREHLAPFGRRQRRSGQVLAQARNQEAEAARSRADSLEQELKDLKAQRTDRGLVLTLGDVLFDTGKSTLKPGAYATIDRLATALREEPTRKVMIEGHTDSDGADDYNMRLSQDRANSVGSYLQSRGVNHQRIVVLGFGESRPIAPNTTPDGKQQNRRVELKLQPITQG